MYCLGNCLQCALASTRVARPPERGRVYRDGSFVMEQVRTRLATRSMEDWACLDRGMPAG